MLVLVLALSGCGSQSGTATEVGTPRVPPPPGIETACPPWDAPVRYAEGDLPPGAESVRLCPGPPIVAYDGTLSDPGIQSPEVLTTRVDELVSVVNGLEPTPEDLLCFGDGGPRLTYWFTYPDGDARAVTFEHFGCEVLLVGDDARRLEGGRVARLFTEALLAQRTAGQPPRTVPAAPDCREVFATPISTLPHEPVDLVSASVCDLARPNHVRQADVPADLRARLERGLLGSDVEWPRCGQVEGRSLVLLGYTSWGDRVQYGIDTCGRVGLPRPPGWLREPQPAFRLPEDLAGQLDALPFGPVVRFISPIRRITPPAE